MEERSGLHSWRHIDKNVAKWLTAANTVEALIWDWAQRLSSANTWATAAFIP